MNKDCLTLEAKKNINRVDYIKTKTSVTKKIGINKRIICILEKRVIAYVIKCWYKEFAKINSKSTLCSNYISEKN